MFVLMLNIINRDLIKGIFVCGMNFTCTLIMVMHCREFPKEAKITKVFQSTFLILERWWITDYVKNRKMQDLILQSEFKTFMRTKDNRNGKYSLKQSWWKLNASNENKYIFAQSRVRWSLLWIEQFKSSPQGFMQVISRWCSMVG